MRLTLRTLLAYLDDRLSPGNARELGQKIVHSPFATELADRIKDVVRRRRLAADSGDHKSIDANLIAEYLDDQLTPELVALIEKEILESDHNLAEVAASHQIIGLLSDPVEISDQLKSRLHRLDPFIDADESSADGSGQQSEQVATWQPLTPQTATQKRSPMLLLLLMVLGWLVLLFTDAHLFQDNGSVTDQTVANNDPNVPKTPGAELNGSGDSQESPNSQSADQSVPSVPETVVATDAASVTTPAADVPPMSVPATAAATVPESVSPAVVKADANPDVTTLPATTTAPAAPTVPSTADTQPTVAATAPGSTDPVAATVGTAAVPSVPQRVFEVRDSNKMLIMRDASTASWVWATTPETTPNGNWAERLSSNLHAMPEPFQAVVIGRDAGWSAIILGSSVFSAANDEASGIHLIEGRLVLQRGATTAANSFSLRLNDQTVMIRIPDGTSRVGVRVTLLPTAIPEEDRGNDLAVLPQSAPSIVTVFAPDEDVTLKTEGAEQPIVISRGKAWQWETTLEPPTIDAALPTGIPEWVFKATQPQPESTTKLIEETATAFRAESSVGSAATAMSSNRNPQLSAYAVRLSALTRNISQLTSFLLLSDNDVVRREAIAGLQTIIRQSDAGRDSVAASLSTRLSAMELDNAMKLLSGISRTAAEDRFVSKWLVEMLESNRLAMREMAIVNLESLTNEGNGFFANDDGGRRAAAVRRWQRMLDRNDGRLVKPAE